MDLGLIVENDLLKVLIAAGTMVLENGHGKAPFLMVP